MPAGAPCCREDGFTLIEMLVTLGVLGLAAGIAFPSVERAMRSQQFASAAAGIDLAVREARADAVQRGATQSLTPLPGRTGLRRPTGEAIALPVGARIEVSGEGVSFYRDGSSSGGSIALLDGPRGRRWDISAGTGLVRVRR